MNKLDEIVAYKKQEIEPTIALTKKLRASALMRNDFAGFRTALDRGKGKLGLIAEVKKASPSAGIIDPNFDPIRQAKRYIDGGASCMSILTDEKFFQGHLSYLTQISKISPIPLLRKDFMIHECQIYEAIVSGADAILLIAACLDDDLMKHLYETAQDFQLDVLVEVHDLPEMERALDLGADLIGINNRNLKEFTTDLTTTQRLAEEVPDDVILVSESGLKSPADAEEVLKYGANAILIGETLMRADDASRACEEYINIEIEVPEEEV